MNYTLTFSIKFFMVAALMHSGCMLHAMARTRMSRMAGTAALGTISTSTVAVTASSTPKQQAGEAAAADPGSQQRTADLLALAPRQPKQLMLHPAAAAAADSAMAAKSFVVGSAAQPARVESSTGERALVDTFAESQGAGREKAYDEETYKKYGSSLVPWGAGALLLGSGYMYKKDPTTKQNPEEYESFTTEEYDPVLELKKTQQEQFNTFIKLSDDLQSVDPELYRVALKIKQDLGITTPVIFRVGKKRRGNMEASTRPFVQSSLRDAMMFIFTGKLPNSAIFATVLWINPGYKNMSKSSLIHLLAHELEHVRQIHGYFGSTYGFPIVSRDMAYRIAQQQKMETGADAAAMDYTYCPDCLKRSAQYFADTHDPRDTLYGYFTTGSGYASKQDFELYIDRACQANASCRAHREGTADKPDTPLEHFLPDPVK